MPSYKTKAFVCSQLFFICLCSAAAQLQPNDCAGAPLYTTAGLEARDAADVLLYGKPACQRIPRYLDQMIFTGTATRVISSEGRALLNGECSRTELQTVTITVQEVFAGHPPRSFTVHAGDINGVYFTTNKRYLIIAHQNADGTFAVNPVATKPLIDAKEDLAYLRSLSSRPTTAEIFGSVFEVFPPPHDRFIPIVAPESLPVSSTPGKVEIRSNRSGRYKFTGLAPGRYTVHLNTERLTQSDDTETIEVAPRGCAEINFYIVKPLPPTKSEKKH